MRFVVAFLLIAVFCPPVSAAAMDRDVRILEMDDRGLTVELAAPAIEIEACAMKGPEGQPYRQVRIKDWASIDRAGSPELPVKGFLVQVPRAGRVEARVLESIEEETLPAGRIAPVPKQTLMDDGSILETFKEDEGIYGSQGLFPASPVEVGDRMLCRGASLVRVMVHPLRWDPATGEVRISRRLKLRIEHEEPLVTGASGADRRALNPGAHADVRSGGGEGAFDRLLEGTVLNYRGPEVLPPDPAGGAGTESMETLPPAGSKQAAPQVQPLRIEVREEGIYRISYEDLTSAGFATSNVRPWMFRLHNLGQELAIKVVSHSGWWRFTSGDYIEFYGQGADTPFTDTNVYWLSAWSGTGKRVAQIDGQVTGLDEPVDVFRETIRVEENHAFWEATPGAPEEDSWFWEKMTAPATAQYAFDVPSPAADRNGAVVRVAFQGRSTAAPHPNHHTTIGLNGAQIGEAFWDGDVAYVQETFPAAELIQDGPNTLTIGLPGDSGVPMDIVYPNGFEVEYTRALEARDDRLRFSLAGTGRVEVAVTNLSGPDVRIYDVTDSLDVKEIVHFTVEADGEAYKAIFGEDLNGTKSCLVVAASRIAGPPGISCWKTPSLKSSQNGADYLLITAREFIPATWPLLWLRWRQGLRVRVVGVEDIYNTFSFGLTDPQAIQDFLRCAYETWTPPAPTYALLLGDANTDYRDFMATGKKSRVPVHLSVTSDLGLTPDDNWYACVDGDDALPDLFIGRIPAASPEGVSELAWKLFLYEISQAPPPAGALFAADDDDTAFEDLNESLVADLPEGFLADRVYLRLYGDEEEATEDIVTGLDEGRMITTYTGHGAVTNWAGEYLFESSDVARLNNGEHLTFVVTLDCLNGYFSHFSYYCIAEEFVAAPFKGAVACFSPSGLGYTWEHRILANELFSRLFEQGDRCLGSLTTQSKIAAHGQGASEEMLKTFTLLGDPALSLNGWQ